MKKVIALVLAVCMIFGLAACSGGKQESAASTMQKIKDKGELVVGTSADYPPYEFHKEINGVDTIVGFDMSIAQAIADDLGVELKVVDMSFDNLIMSLVNGEFDMVIAGMTSTEEREKIVNFTEAYLKSKILLLMRKGTENMFANYGELMGAKAAAQTGTTHYDNCVQFCGTENVVGLSKVQDMVMELEAGKVDLVFMDYMAVLSYAAKKDDLVAVDLDIPNDYEGYKIATQKDATDFRDYLDEFLVKLNESGQIEKFIVEAQDLAEGE